MPEFEPYQSEAEIKEVVRRFENCEYRPEEFVHAKHMTAAAWYFLQFGRETACERMRAGLLKFIRHHGKHGYHETITEFWLRIVCCAVRDSRSEGNFVHLINGVVERFNVKGLIYEYYSRERLDSAKAKMGWIEPDLKTLPGVV